MCFAGWGSVGGRTLVRKESHSCSSLAARALSSFNFLVSCVHMGDVRVRERVHAHDTPHMCLQILPLRAHTERERCITNLLDLLFQLLLQQSAALHVLCEFLLGLIQSMHECVCVRERVNERERVCVCVVCACVRECCVCACVCACGVGEYTLIKPLSQTGTRVGSMTLNGYHPRHRPPTTNSFSLSSARAFQCATVSAMTNC